MTQPSPDPLEIETPDPEAGHPQPIVDRIRAEYGWVDGAGYPSDVDVAQLFRDPSKAIITAHEWRDAHPRTETA